MQTAFAFEQLAFVPPFKPAHVQVRVVQQAVAPLSQDAVPAVHAPAVVEHAQFIGQAPVLHACEVAPTVPQTASVPWVQDWEGPGFAERQSESASVEPSYFKHATVLVWVPFAFLVQVAVLVWVHHPHVTEQVPHAEYPQLQVSPEQVPQVQADQVFATHEVPFQEDPAEQESPAVTVTVPIFVPSTRAPVEEDEEGSFTKPETDQEDQTG